MVAAGALWQFTYPSLTFDLSLRPINPARALLSRGCDLRTAGVFMKVKHRNVDILNVQTALY